MHISRAPLLVLTVLFVIGIYATLFQLSAWVPMAAFAAGLLLMWLGRREAGVGMLGLGLGMACAWLMQPPQVPAEWLDGRPRLFSATVREVTADEPNQVAVIAIDSCGGVGVSPRLAKFVVYSTEVPVRVCDRVTFTAPLRELTFMPQVPDEVDFDHHLKRRGIRVMAAVNPEDISACIPEPGVLNDIRRLREPLSMAILTLPLGRRTCEFLNTVVTGDRSWLSPDVHEMFSAVGLAHVMALSGMHVGLLSGLLLVVLLPLVRSRYHIVASVLICLALWLYAVMTGLSASVTRAVIMATVFLLAQELQRERTALNALCVAALMILVVTPSALFSPGFQLSFLAVLSILLLAPKLNPFPPHRKLLHRMAMLPAVSVAAVLGTTPVVAYTFGTFPVWFLPANLLAFILLPVVIWGGLAVLFLDCLGVGSGWLCRITDGAYTCLERGVDLLAGLHAGGASVGYMSPVALLGMAACVAALATILYRTRVAYSIACLAVAIGCTLYSLLDIAPGHSGEHYLVTTNRHTSLLICDGDTLRVATSLRPPFHADLMDELGVKCHMFMRRRGLKGMAMVDDGYTSRRLVRHGGAVWADGRTYRFLNREYPLGEMSGKVDYAIVAFGFTGDVTEISRVLAPDSVLLGSDLPARLARRFGSDLAEAGIPYRHIQKSEE